MTTPAILLLPGWQNSDPSHWQSRWEAVHGDRRVEQHEWMRPLRGDWSARLEEEVLAELSHIPLALLAVVAGWARWLEIRLPANSPRITARLWPVSFVLIGVVLLLYREA